jgi:hypothetical protein
MSKPISHVSSYPGYAEALAVLNELSVQQEAELQRQRELAEGLAVGAKGAEPSPEDILAMQQNGDLGDIAAGRPESLGDQLNKSYVAHHRLGMAIKVQHDKLDALRQAAAAAALVQAQPRYQSLADAMGGAIENLFKAAEGFRALDREFIDAGMGPQAPSAPLLAGLPIEVTNSLRAIQNRLRFV